jgi:hypothetical protein
MLLRRLAPQTLHWTHTRTHAHAEFLSSESQNLLKGLLIRDASKRLGSGSDGSDAVKRHPFFKTINWARLEAREIESRFKPSVSCNMDVGECCGAELWGEHGAAM